MTRSRLWLLLAFMSLWTRVAPAADAPLIVVQDVGGVSALPYYRALNLQHPPLDQTPPAVALPPPAVPKSRYSEADLLPARSADLSPGTVASRAIQAPGLTPLFLIGDDARSRAWLHGRLETLRALHAVGFVVNVESFEALISLRELAPGLTLAPASGDDMARRLNIHHYPVLITPTGIEQ